MNPIARMAARLQVEREDGWLIVELMIGAVVLVLTALAIYSGLDGASKASGRNRNRTVAAYLAQQDQERMRTMDAAALGAGYTNTRTVTVANVPYRVDSKATLISDTSGSVSCTNKSSSANYLKITSTVYDPSGKNAPVVQDSLLSPKPDDGNAAVQAVDRTGITGVSGISVGLQEPPGETVTTDTNGCSLFTFLDNATQYHVSFSKSGYVDVNGNPGFTNAPITVVPGTVSTTQFQYDQAGTITAQFVTGSGGGSRAAACSGLSLSNSHMTINPRIRTFDAPSTCSSGSPSNVATNLFPFTDAYSIYAGECQANDPTRYGDSTTFAPILGPGGSVSQNVPEPSFNVTVKKTVSGTTSIFSGADVHVTEKTEYFSDGVTQDTACQNNTFPPETTNSNSSNNLVTPGHPYGHYTVCADNNAGDSASATVNNTSQSSGSNSVTLNVNSSSNNGNCP